MILRISLFLFALIGAQLRADDNAIYDAKILADSGIAASEKGLREFFRKRTPTADDLATIAALVKQLGDRSFQKRMQASDALSVWGPAALDSLRLALKEQDIEIIRRAERCIADITRAGTDLPIAAVRQAARSKMPGGVPVLLAYLPNADDETVADAVLESLRVLCDPKTPDDAVLKAVSDSTPVRRAAAGHILGRHSSKVARAAAVKLLADPEFSVRFRAAESLLLGREKAAVTALIGLLRPAPAEIRWQTEDLLSRLPACIKGAPPAPLSPIDDKPETLRQWHDAWAAWWVKHADAADLARLEDRAAFLNLTLVPEMHANKVWEFGQDGKVRWELATDLKRPIDAQVLPNGRILVAELDGGRVTERDRKGAILWQHAVQTPIYVRRMTGGNTFISTNQSCFIVTPAGKEVFRYNAENGFFIHSIQQMPNHHIAAISMAGEVREIARDGKVLRTLKLGEGVNWSGIEGLSGSRYLCAGSGKVREIDATGKVIWKLDYPNACFATRLPSGNTLVVDNARGLAEVNREGKTIWTRNLTTSLWRVHRR